MTSGAREVIYKPTGPGQNTNHRWAQIRTAQTFGTKTAQYSGMMNNTVTQPDFYSPFLTPSSFQIPNTRKEMYMWAEWWVTNEPKVAAGIDFYTNFPFNGWKLECKSSVVKDYFEKLLEKLNFQRVLPEISYHYYLYGDSFPFATIDCKKCKGSMIDPDDFSKECDHKGATWKSVTVLNPDSIMVSPGIMDAPPTFYYIPTEREQKIVMERQPKEVYDLLSDDLKNLIAQNQPIKFNNLCIHHFKHASAGWKDYGVSLVRPLFTALAYRDKLRQAQWIVAERHIVPVRIVTVGDAERPASQSDIDSVKDQLSFVANDPNLTLVTPHAFDYKYVGASNQILKVTDEFELLNQELLDGMMLNKALLNGEGPSYNNAQVGLVSMNKRLETWRQEVALWIREKIFKPVAEWNDFYTEGEGGQKELVYPDIIFDDLKLKDNTGVLQQMVQCQQNGVLSAQTVVEEMGINWDQEVERLRFEQGLNFINSTDIMNTDMNIGFGGVSGNGFGAGLNQPLTPGAGGPAAPGAPEGGAMGEPPLGGGAPAPGAAPAPGGAPPATAEQIYDQYRFSVSLMNEILFNRMSNAEINMQKFATKIDKELNQREPVTGRSIEAETIEAFKTHIENFSINQLMFPEDLDLIEPWECSSVGEPLNYQASKNLQWVRTAAQKKDTPLIHGYTSIEKKLYNLVMGMRVPLAFYAQYEAGPGQEYTLDGAFPAIKLGLEADGEIWHNNPNKLQTDRQRDLNLARQGWTILRFTDKELEKQAPEVMGVIQQALQKLLGNARGKLV